MQRMGGENKQKYMKEDKSNRFNIKGAIISGLFVIVAAVIGIIPNICNEKIPEPEIAKESGPFSIVEESQPSFIAWASKSDSATTERSPSQIVEEPKTYPKEEIGKEVVQKEIPENITTKAFIEIEETILFKGKTIPNAYFVVRNCIQCKSTKSGFDGRVTISVPVDFIEGDEEYDFDVFVEDSLLYSRSMRFSNLNFNKY